MPPPRGIEKPWQILVEGRDAEGVIAALSSHFGLDAQVQDFGGVTELRVFMKAFRNLPGFDGSVRALVVIRDAESSPSAAFDSAADAIAHAGFVRPLAHAHLTTASPRTGVFVLPDGEVSGTLETLCVIALQESPAFACIEPFIECAERATGVAPHLPDKARIQAYLATTNRAGIALRDAARARLLRWDHPAFEALRTFLVAACRP